MSYMQGSKPYVVCETFPGREGSFIGCYRSFAGRGDAGPLCGQRDGGDNAEKQ